MGRIVCTGQCCPFCLFLFFLCDILSSHPVVGTGSGRGRSRALADSEEEGATSVFSIWHNDRPATEAISRCRSLLMTTRARKSGGNRAAAYILQHFLPGVYGFEAARGNIPSTYRAVS